jgi:hypothetical protein
MKRLSNAFVHLFASKFIKQQKASYGWSKLWLKVVIHVGQFWMYLYDYTCPLGIGIKWLLKQVKWAQHCSKGHPWLCLIVHGVHLCMN